MKFTLLESVSRKFELKVIIVTLILGTSPHVTFSRKQQLCHEIAQFTPNMCQYSTARRYCKQLCKHHKDLQLHCGENQKIKSRIRRIVGGVKSRPGEWPWQVSLRINGTQWCAGSILSENFILTAAHCFDAVHTSLKAEDWYIHIGDHHLSRYDTSEQRIQAKRIIAHAKYNLAGYGNKPKQWAMGHHDIALMQLKHSIKFNVTTRPTVCLPDRRKRIHDYYNCYVVGWGHTSFNGTQPDELRHAKVYTVPNSVCNKEVAYNNSVNPKELICAGYKNGGIDACNYDSGGGLVCNKEDRWYATGIVSSGYECARPDSYGLYTNVAEYKKWIIENILRKAD